MSKLVVPDEFGGPWKHALILTFGAELPFFENGLWRQLPSGCHNRVILMDGAHYLQASQIHARDGLARQINQRYVVDGMFAAHAAHAKVILLASPSRGRLLVGSGNMTWQGYASGGELFVKYDYSSEAPASLPAFGAVWELTEYLLAQQLIGPVAARHISYMLEEAPWLIAAHDETDRPVRHNLVKSFLDQLRDAAGTDPIEELWVLSPFYDPDAFALERLLAEIRPARTTLLVQPGQTSVDPLALARVVERFGDRCQVRPFTVAGTDCYVHAKLYLLKLANRAVCLQGSPNLSRVAMLRVGTEANIEVANLLVGARDEFDYLLDNLTLGPIASALTELNLSLQSDDVPESQTKGDLVLLGGEWSANLLALRFRGFLPDLSAGQLSIGGRSFPVSCVSSEQSRLRLRLSPEEIDLLSQAAPVRLRWKCDGTIQDSNPIFPCNEAALSALLEAGGDELRRAGSLDLDDAEVEDLLEALSDALVIDHQSFWQIAAPQVPGGSEPKNEDQPLNYTGVDYDAIMRHPKMRQYLYGQADRPSARSRLQIILSSITDHFTGLIDAFTSPKVTADGVVNIDEMMSDSEDEYEEELERKEQKHQSDQQRRRRVIKAFVAKYLRGIRAKDFQQAAGYEVMGQNYIIFPHVLWRFLAKDWVDRTFLVSSLLDIWLVFWGTQDRSGYISSLSDEQRRQICTWMRTHHSDAELLAALYYCMRVVELEQLDDLRLPLRDFTRGLFSQLPYQVTPEILEEMWLILADRLPIDPPLPSTVVDEWARFARLGVRHELSRALDQRFGLTPGSCRFEKVRVRHPSRPLEVHADCLVIPVAGGQLDADTALEILRDWMRFEDRDYFRLSAPDKDHADAVAYYDKMSQTGLFWRRSGGERTVASLEPLPAVWDAPLDAIRTIAVQIDRSLQATRPIGRAG